MSSSSRVVIVKHDHQKLINQVQAIAGKAVYVGVPSDKVDRSAGATDAPADGGAVADGHAAGESPGTESNAAEEGTKKKQPTNAEIAYWMEFGLPDQNVPARPSIVPGTKMALGKMIRYLKAGVKETLETGDPAGVEDSLHKAGLAAVSSIKRKIVDGPFDPLAAATLAARRRRGNETDSPLRDTLQFFRSITYVIRKS